MSDREEQNTEEMVEIDEEQGRKDSARLEECIQELKSAKRSAKSRMTKLLNSLAGIISDNNSEHAEIKHVLLGIDQQKEETLEIMTQLERLYREKDDQQNVIKVSDEADSLVDQVERETSSARMFLLSLAKSQSSSSSVVTMQVKESKEKETVRKAKEEAELEARLRKEKLEAEVQKQKEQLCTTTTATVASG